MRTDLNLEQKGGATLAAQDILNRFEPGSNTFTVRDGKILSQTFAGALSPKPSERP